MLYSYRFKTKSKSNSYTYHTDKKLPDKIEKHDIDKIITMPCPNGFTYVLNNKSKMKLIYIDDIDFLLLNLYR
jgi:hypothetical protein